MSNGVIRGTGNWTDIYAYRLPLYVIHRLCPYSRQISSLSALQWIFPVILLIGLPFAPESPWWLVRKGRYVDAERVLSHLGGPTIDAKLQRQQIHETIELEDTYAATSTYMDCFRGKSFLFQESKIRLTRGVLGENLKRTIVAMMVFVLQQCAGEDQPKRKSILVTSPYLQAWSLSWDTVHTFSSSPGLPRTVPLTLVWE